MAKNGQILLIYGNLRIIKAYQLSDLIVQLPNCHIDIDAFQAVFGTRYHLSDDCLRTMFGLLLRELQVQCALHADLIVVQCKIIFQIICPVHE